MNTDIKDIRIKKRLVLDTTALISYYSSIFEQPPQISQRALSLIDNAFKNQYDTILIIPGIVFVEIFDKWFRRHDLEFNAKFLAEVFQPIKAAPNIEIREIDYETLEIFLLLEDPAINLENRDRLVLAAAAILQATLITSDQDMIDFVNKYKTLLSIVS